MTSLKEKVEVEKRKESFEPWGIPTLRSHGEKEKLRN